MEERQIIDLLAAREFPALAAAVRASMPQVLQQWERLVREAIPKADGLTRPQLWDDAPKVLEHVARSLESSESKHTHEFVDATWNHGVTRFEQSFDLRELLLEYTLLRAVLLDEVLLRLGRPPQPIETIALNGALDVMSRRSAQAFVDFQSRELRAATEAQSKYLSFLSHDMRGGLNGVFLMIEVLKRELSSEPRLASTISDLDTMRRSLLDTIATMDRFLYAERFRKGKVQLRPTRVDLPALLNELVAHFSYQAREKGLELQVVGTEHCTLHSDRELLTIILQNLLSNAIKYTDKGTIVARAEALEGGECLVSVKDQGPGIAAERLNELFAPFTRGETHGRPGVGLGLSIARQAADFLGAKLWAESVLSQGSEFFLRVPSIKPAADATGKSKSV